MTRRATGISKKRFPRSGCARARMRSSAERSTRCGWRRAMARSSGSSSRGSDLRRDDGRVVGVDRGGADGGSVLCGRAAGDGVVAREGGGNRAMAAGVSGGRGGVASGRVRGDDGAGRVQGRVVGGADRGGFVGIWEKTVSRRDAESAELRRVDFVWRDL